MTNILYNKILDAEAIVIGSPCYYGEVSGLMKSLMDRSIALGYMGEPIKKIIGDLSNTERLLVGLDLRERS